MVLLDNAALHPNEGRQWHHRCQVFFPHSPPTTEPTEEDGVVASQTLLHWPSQTS